jgi:hypothetical protein
MDKEENKTYIKIAYREADEHSGLYWFITVFLIGLWASVLIIMSVYDLSIRSLISRFRWFQRHDMRYDRLLWS